MNQSARLAMRSGVPGDISIAETDLNRSELGECPDGYARARG